MPSYSAPLRDHLFCLYDVLDFEEHRKLPGFEDFSRDVIEAVLEQAGRFTSEIVFPLNRSGDEEGARFDNGVVTVPRRISRSLSAHSSKADGPHLPAIQNMAARACRIW
jgi:hypothetical protein